MKSLIAAGIVVVAIGLSVFGGVGVANADPSPSPDDPFNVTVRIPGNTGGSHGGNSGGGRPSPTPAPSGSPVTAPPVAAFPTSGAAHLVLEPHRAHRGDVVMATAHGFTPGEQVQFVSYPERVVLGSFPVGQGDTIVAKITIAKNLGTGEHTIEATGWASHRVANAVFTIIQGDKNAESSSTWITWMVGAGALLCAIAASLIASANGWLPVFLSMRSAA